jgi:hypothetical protein
MDIELRAELIARYRAGVEEVEAYAAHGFDHADQIHRARGATPGT